uniref:G-protein coupled receptors family 1 profile domain-containing protein n=1 Tax=Petromyzon marinus TaxID=7757 RepID=S4RZH4_PETMA
VIIALYGLATVLALSGNAVVVWVLALGRRARTDISAFLINLALADLTMALFCLPFTFTEVLLQSWLFGALLCPLVRFAQTLSVSVSIYTLTTIGIDRYYAVCHPLHSRMTKSRGKVLIALIWAVSISISLSTTTLAVATRGPMLQLGKGKCLEVGWPSRGYQQSYTVALLLGTYLLPLLVLTLAYSSVAVRLWGRRTPGNVDHNRELHQERSKRKLCHLVFFPTIFVVVVVVVLIEIYIESDKRGDPGWLRGVQILAFNLSISSPIMKPGLQIWQHSSF